MKKGDGRLLLLTVFMLVIAIGIGVMVTIRARDARDPTKHQKDFISKDLAIMLDELYGLPWNFHFVYGSNQDNFSDYSYEFLSTLQAVRGTGSIKLGGMSAIVGDTKTKRYFKYIPDGTIGGKPMGANLGGAQSDIFIFRKDGDTFDGYADNLRMPRLPEPIQLRCGFEDLPSYDTIVLDPGHGSKDDKIDTGIVSITREDFNEANHVFKVAETIESKLEGKTILFTRGKDKDDYQTIEERKATIEQASPQAIISLHMNNREGGDIVKAYVPVGSRFDQSKLLGCKILKSITRRDERGLPLLSGIRGVAIVPVNLDTLEEDDPLRVLSSSIPSVQLELGSINSAGDVTKFFDMGEAIAEVFE